MFTKVLNWNGVSLVHRLHPVLPAVEGCKHRLWRPERNLPQLRDTRRVWYRGIHPGRLLRRAQARRLQRYRDSSLRPHGNLSVLVHVSADTSCCSQLLVHHLLSPEPHIWLAVL